MIPLRKDFEEFFTEKESLDMERFKTLGVIKNEAKFNEEFLENSIMILKI